MKETEISFITIQLFHRSLGQGHQHNHLFQNEKFLILSFLSVQNLNTAHTVLVKGIKQCQVRCERKKALNYFVKCSPYKP